VKARTSEAARAAQAELARASDAELGEALIGAHPDAFHVAWRRFLPLVRHLVRRRLGPGAEIDDAVQEVFFALFKRVQMLRDPGALRAFVIGITVRTASYERRRAGNRTFPSWDAEGDVGALRISADPAAKHAFVSLQHLVTRLRERDRVAFMLRFVQGMDSQEIGEVLGVSALTARRSFSRAWQRLNLWASRDRFLADYLPQEGSDAAHLLEPETDQ
jgi:RNA polymerase sigma-70 factor (ECF subfamily)